MRQSNAPDNPSVTEGPITGRIACAVRSRSGLPPGQRLRRLLITIHLVVGLSAGLLLSLVGLTGSLLVFRHEIEGATDPALRRVAVPRSAARASLDAVLEAAGRAVPGATVRHIFLGEHPENSHEVWLAGTEKRVYVDPYTGQALGVRDDSGSLTGWLFALHSKLLSGETGEQVVGWSGVVLLFLAVSGVVLWWPARARDLPDRLRVKTGAGPARATFDLHRAGGFYASGLLVLVAVTGTALVFDDGAKAFLSGVTASPANPSPPPTNTASLEGIASGSPTPAPVSALVVRADAAVPEGTLRRVSFPAKPGGPVVVRKRLPSDPHPNGMTYIYLDPATGTVLRVDRSDRATPAQALMNLRYPLHIGQWGGRLTQILHALVGLMPGLLFITGLRLWANKMAKRRTRARQIIRTASE